MKTNLLFVLLFISYLTHAQVEINASSVNAELEINSQTKGMRLPRIVKPEIVNQPNEGLVIYDQASQAPAFHNGTNWKNWLTGDTIAFDFDAKIFTTY